MQTKLKKKSLSSWIVLSVFQYVSVERSIQAQTAINVRAAHKKLIFFNFCYLRKHWRLDNELAISGNYQIYRQMIEILTKELQEDEENMDLCKAEWTEFIAEVEV